MKKLIYSLPLPSAGLMLGLAAAGNLVSSHGNVFRIIFGTLSAMLMALLIFKMIFAAPPALCLVGYLNTFQEINMTVIWLLALLSLTTLFAVLLYMPRMLKLKFYPSYAAFTFPIVISATAVKNIDIFLKNEQMGLSALRYLACFLELLAVALVIYVLIRYTVFMRNMLMIKRAGSVAANT